MSPAGDAAVGTFYIIEMLRITKKGCNNFFFPVDLSYVLSRKLRNCNEQIFIPLFYLPHMCLCFIFLLPRLFLLLLKNFGTQLHAQRKSMALFLLSFSLFFSCILHLHRTPWCEKGDLYFSLFAWVCMARDADTVHSILIVRHQSLA